MHIYVGDLDSPRRTLHTQLTDKAHLEHDETESRAAEMLVLQKGTRNFLSHIAEIRTDEQQGPPLSRLNMPEEDGR